MIVMPEPHAQIQYQDIPQQPEKRMNRQTYPVNHQYGKSKNHDNHYPAHSGMMNQTCITPLPDTTGNYPYRSGKKLTCPRRPEMVDQQCTKKREKNHGTSAEPSCRYNNLAHPDNQTPKCISQTVSFCTNRFVILP